MDKRNNTAWITAIDEDANRNRIIADCFGDIRASLDALNCASRAGNHEAVKVFYDRINSTLNNVEKEI